MPQLDTLTFEKIENIESLNYSLFRTLLDVSKQIEALDNKSILPLLLPLIGVLIGGFITYITQRKLKSADNRIVRQKDLRTFVYTIYMNITNLTFALKEMAYLEVDSKYQFYLSQTEKEDDNKKKALDEHYNDYKYIAENRSKMSNAFSEIQAAFNSYYSCKDEKMPVETANKLNAALIHLLNLPRASEYDIKRDPNTLPIQSDIENLYSSYSLKLPELKSLVDSL